MSLEKGVDVAGGDGLWTQAWPAPSACGVCRSVQTGSGAQLGDAGVQPRQLGCELPAFFLQFAKTRLLL